MKIYDIDDDLSHLDYMNEYPGSTFADDYICWKMIPYKIDISIAFINKYADYIGWDILSILSIVTNDNIRREFIDKIDFETLSYMTHLMGTHFIDAYLTHKDNK